MKDYVVRDSRAYRVANAMRIIELLVDEGPTSTAQLAARTEISRTTARRIMVRLELDGYVERVQGRDRRLGRGQPASGLQDLARRVLSQGDRPFS
jgi:DNA-binding IclR family transcriptional regulator